MVSVFLKLDVVVCAERANIQQLSESRIYADETDFADFLSVGGVVV